MARRLSLLALAVGSALLLLAALLGGRVAEWLATALVAAFPVLFIALGAADRRGGLGRLVPWLVALLVLLEGGLLGALYLSSEAGRGWSFGGLPAATALFLFGAGLAALVWTGVAYAITFPRSDGGDR
jgi:hypothetical protein